MSDPTTYPEPVSTDPTRVSPKVVISTVLALIVPGVIAGLSYIQDNFAVLGIDNPILGTAVLALIPGLLVFFGGYLKRDPARNG